MAFLLWASILANLWFHFRMKSPALKNKVQNYILEDSVFCFCFLLERTPSFKPLPHQVA